MHVISPRALPSCVDQWRAALACIHHYQPRPHRPHYWLETWRRLHALCWRRDAKEFSLLHRSHSPACCCEQPTREGPPTNCYMDTYISPTVHQNPRNAARRSVMKRGAAHGVLRSNVRVSTDQLLHNTCLALASGLMQGSHGMRVCRVYIRSSFLDKILDNCLLAPAGGIVKRCPLRESVRRIHIHCFLETVSVTRLKTSKSIERTYPF